MTGCAAASLQTNSSMWDAFYDLPATIPAGHYTVAIRNALQPDWSAFNGFESKDKPHVQTFEIAPGPPPGASKIYAVADHMAAFGIPSGAPPPSSTDRTRPRTPPS